MTIDFGDFVSVGPEGETKKLKVTSTHSYSSSIGWNPDGTLTVKENGVEVTGEDAARVVGNWGMAVGWPLLETALDPDGSKRAEHEREVNEQQPDV